MPMPNASNCLQNQAPLKSSAVTTESPCANRAFWENITQTHRRRGHNEQHNRTQQNLRSIPLRKRNSRRSRTYPAHFSAHASVHSRTPILTLLTLATARVRRSATPQTPPPVLPAITNTHHPAFGSQTCRDRLLPQRLSRIYWRLRRQYQMRVQGLWEAPL